MARVENPVITVKQIKGIKPGETLVVSNIDEKKKRSIFSMIWYVKETNKPCRVKNYKCSYNPETHEVSIKAIPYSTYK